MLITETQLRTVIRTAILQEAWYHDLFGLEDKSGKPKQRAKKNLALLKKYIKQGMDTDEALELISAENKKYIDKAYPPTFSDRIHDLEEEHEEIEDMLYNSMSRDEKYDWMNQKYQRRKRELKDGSYYKNLALNFQ